MKTKSFWMLVVLNYLGISLVIFIIFDLIPTVGGIQALNPSNMLIRIPTAMGLALLFQWYHRREQRRQAQ